MHNTGISSKNRVKDVFAGRIPDRPPLGFFAIDSDTAGKILGRETFWRAKAKSQIAFWQGRRDEVVQSWIQDGIELYKKLDMIDIIPVCVMAAGMCPPKDYDPAPPRRIDDNTWEDKSGRVYKYSAQTKDITIIQDPNVWSENFSLESYRWDGKIEAPDNSVFEAVDALINEFKTDRFVIGPSGDETAWLLPGGMERGFMEIAQHPGEIREIYESRVDRAIAHDRYYIRPEQDAVMGGEDFACTNGPLISPHMYREVFLPGFKRRIAAFRSYNKPFIKHCCGNTAKYLDIFTDLGIDCYQSIQKSAGMDIAGLYDDYSSKFVMWGGVPVEVLIGGTPADIKTVMKGLKEKFYGKSRFILGTTHSVAVGTKYENFMTLLDKYAKWN